MPGQIKVSEEAATREIPVKRTINAYFIAAGVLFAVIAIGFGVWLGNKAPVGAVAERSVAVLPFESPSADSEGALFVMGVQAEIRNDLAKIADLKVISRTSVLQ